MNYEQGYGWLIPGRLAQGSEPPLGRGLYPTFTVSVFCAQELVKQTSAAFPDVVVIKVHLDDAKPSKEEVYRALMTSYTLASRMRANRKERVLITCQQGRNRSGLVSALTLMNLGWSADQAITRIRHVRRNALTNRHFVQVIREYERLPRLGVQ